MDQSACMDTSVLNLPLEVKAGAEPGVFEGYGAIFGNQDRDGDIVAPGAFKDSLKGRLPALLWQHNAKEPIGRFDEVREDAKGLYVKGRLSLQGRGLEAYELLKMGALDGLSIGFVTKEASRNTLTGARTIRRAELMEISLVTFPANELARISSVKTMNSADGVPGNPRAFERLLRDNGFSRSRAKAITAKGWIPSNISDDTSEDMLRILERLELSKERLQEKRLGSFGRAVRGPNKAKALSEALGLVKKAYRAISPTRMPMHLLEGESRSFTLGMLRGNTKGKFQVATNGSFIGDFKVTYGYWTWTDEGPNWRSGSINEERTSGFLIEREDVDMGSFSVIEKWLSHEWERFEARNALADFDQVIGRLHEMITYRGLAPRGTITLTKLVAAQTLPISSNPNLRVRMERPVSVLVK